MLIIDCRMGSEIVMFKSVINFSIRDIREVVLNVLVVDTLPSSNFL